MTTDDLDTLRERYDAAGKDGVKVTALLREWIEQNVAEGTDDDHTVPAAELKRPIARADRDRQAG